VAVDLIALASTTTDSATSWSGLSGPVSAIKAIQSYGMVTVAGMIIGFDTDDAAIFEI